MSTSSPFDFDQPTRLDPPPPSDARNCEIMLIDDSPSIRAMIQATFHRLDIPVVTFPDGLSAIRALSAQAVSVPRVLLLDLDMPLMDGYEVARILRSKESFRHTRLIILTGKDGVLDRFRTMFLGPHIFIAKPFKITDLVETVIEQLEATE